MMKIKTVFTDQDKWSVNIFTMCFTFEELKFSEGKNSES